MRLSRCTARWIVLVPWLCAPTLCAAQDLEPRRWTHLPIGTDVLGVGYVFTTGELMFDPVLRIEDAEVELHTALVTYTHYFAFLERTTRIDVLLPLQSGTWDGLVDGVETKVNREGPSDPVLRLSTILAGAPALGSQEFAQYRQAHPVQTSVGAALELRVPLGEYQEDKLINLGQNRFAFGPQLGVLHTRGEWSVELTGSTIFFTDNDEFFGGNELEQDPLFAVQSHVVKLFGQDFWVSLGAAYGWAGESRVNGAPKDDERSNLVVGSSFGFRLGASQSLRFSYARAESLTDVGSDTDNVYLSWSMRF